MEQINDFRTLVDNYKNKIFTLAYRYTNNINDAEDLSQDVFIKIYSNIDNFNNKSKLSTWIYRIAVNTCLDWCRQKKKYKYIQLENYVDKETRKNIVESNILHHEEISTLYDSINKLSEKYKTVIILYHFEEMTYSEISNILNIPEKTVETRLYRGRKKLRDLLFKYNGGDLNELYQI